jgi:TPR repeat protein
MIIATYEIWCYTQKNKRRKMLLDKDKINELIFEGAHGDTPDNIVKKAGSGDKVSQRILGEMYYRGELLEENFELARMWFTKAARQEDQAAIS